MVPVLFRAVWEQLWVLSGSIAVIFLLKELAWSPVLCRSPILFAEDQGILHCIDISCLPVDCETTGYYYFPS